MLFCYIIGTKGPARVKNFLFVSIGQMDGCPIDFLLKKYFPSWNLFLLPLIVVYINWFILKSSIDFDTTSIWTELVSLFCKGTIDKYILSIDEQYRSHWAIYNHHYWLKWSLSEKIWDESTLFQHFICKKIFKFLTF